MTPGNSDPDEIIPCEVCPDGEVNDPALDWCHVCHRKLCDDCIFARNAEHGLRFCEECHAKEMAAQLVNAGPDLLAACRAMLAALDAHGVMVVDEFGDGEDFRKARRDMRLAVLLATGEEPDEDDE